MHARALIRAAASYYGLTVGELMERDNHHDVTLPRHIAMYLLRQDLGMTVEEIGKSFDRHHTTVVYALQKLAGNEPKDLAKIRDLARVYDQYAA